MRRAWAIPFCTLLLPAALAAADALDSTSSEDGLPATLERISADRMMADVAMLSSSEMAGRQAGTEHDGRSAAWVSDRFQSFGLPLAAISDRPAGIGAPTGLMTTLISAPTIDAEPVLRIGPSYAMQAKHLQTEYLPVLDSPSADIQAPIVFVGYGTPDDYAAVDVTDCIVLFLRGKPDHSAGPVSHAEKVQLARAHGALGYLTAVGPVLNAYDARRGLTGSPSAFYGQLPGTESIPGAWISTPLAEAILAGNSASPIGRLREIQERLNKNAVSGSLRTGQHAQLRWKTRLQEGLLVNVVARLPGTGPDTIVIGAHRDHFGRTAGVLFPGADDNASGTAVLLEVGRVLAGAGRRPSRTIVFVSFSGEEKDLLGSRLYVTRPAAPLASTRAMINIDHAGVGNGRLTIGMTGLDKSVALEAGHKAGLADKLDVYGFFPGGDHVPFKEADIPTATVVSGGVHPHFHQPSDTPDTINPDVLRNAARYVVSLAWRLAHAP